MKHHFNYTDECNPFGDNTLSTPFVWKLKNKYEKIKHGNKIKVTTNSLLENSLSKISEIEQVKKRREERDKERAMFEDYKLQLEKQRNQINIKEYIEQEELFFINQQIQSSDDRISHNHIQIVDIFRIATKIDSGESIQNVYLENYLTPFYYMLEDKNKDEDQKTITVKDLKKERENLMKHHFNYTDECNPFGDNTLSTPFVWKLKNKYEKIKHGNKIKVTTNSLLENSLSKISEIEQVKKRREERDKERAMFEDYKLQLEKQRNQINIKEYIEQEELFFINQQIQSSDDRISHNHIQIVDIFRIATKIDSGESIQNVYLENYLTPFYYMLEDLNERDLENCTKQIKLLISHDRLFNEKKYHNYWNSLYFFCEYYLNKFNDDEPYKAKELDEKTNKKIEEFFKNKDYDELITYEHKIKNKIITNDTEKFDSIFWNNILLKIPFFKAKYILDDFRNKLLKKINITTGHFEKKKISQNRRPNQEKKEIDDSEKIIFECKSIELLPFETFEDDENVHVYLPHEELEERKEINENIFLRLQKNIIDTNIEDEEEREDTHIKYENIKKSDILEKGDELNDNHFNMINKLFTKEKQIYDHFVQKERQKGNKDGIILKDVTYKSNNRINNTITTLLKNNLMISRKPLYFNRIKTSFDWNKYNKTHYDYENTPPKYICGYKFNIFYTNLLNSNQKPSWKICPCDEEGTVLIVFHGGPPYIDIAFKIINSEWSYDKHRGFRNVFSRGILQLYFNFKKKRYRR
ncbi:cactin homolog, putative [Plasmodium chabaudi adami]|uniref:Splicing factor Cactin n=1 Tax=Plasmodium chabaudi adami TaxID=5826 RepID=A0A1D3S109_PLACE|nr:cactin homolog, putative [Plasmodium chabaudi adami]